MSVFGDIVGSALGAGAQIGTGFLAANAQERGAAEASQIQKDIFDRIFKQQKPFVKTGQQAINKLRDIFVTGDTPFTADPGFDFRFQEGVNALDRSAASRGMLFSGAQGKALTQFGQNFATQEQTNVFNRLAALAGIGQTSAGHGAVAGAGLGRTAGVAELAGGAARGSGFANAGNALTSGINNFLTLQALQGQGPGLDAAGRILGGI